MIDRYLACGLMLVGVTVLYFGFLRPHWFSKKAHGQKPSFKDESYFWNIFPYGLFFCIGGLAYLNQPTPSSLLVAFCCAAWVKIVYKLV